MGLSSIARPQGGTHPHSSSLSNVAVHFNDDDNDDDDDEVAKNKYKHYEKELKQNRERVHRCLVYHVNLCPRCEPIFHGVDLSNHTVK